MANDLDLERGDPRRGESDEPTRRRRRTSERKSDDTPKRPDADESEVRTQLARAFDGLAKSREAREDDELAVAIREETEPMTEGFVTLTNNVSFLRMPLILILNLLITLLAFGRVGGILLRRWYERRTMAQEQAEQEQALAAEFDTNGGATEVIG
jgi:hypothetical protein